jgi:hypothetical protein
MERIKKSKWWLAALFEDTSQLLAARKEDGQRSAAMIRRGLSKSAGMMAASRFFSLSALGAGLTWCFSHLI